MASLCPQGHASSEADFCSVCGAAMPPSPAPAPASPAAPAAPRPPGPGASPASTAPCPLCGEPGPHGPSCAFCCYDLALAPLPRVGAASAAPGAAAALTRLIVRVDASLDTEPDPGAPCPVGEPPREILLTGAPMLIGRHDPQLRQEVAVRDPGASRRHAQLVPEGGALWLVDLGSTNGTHVNGAEVASNTRVALSSGDEVTLGRWTRIILK